jgi:hypothetical protein
MAAIGVAALRKDAASLDAPRLVSRSVGAAVALAACALCVFWPVFARRFVHSDQRENDAVAAVLAPGVPTYILGPARGSLTPDDFFTGAPTASYTDDVRSLPSPAAAPRLEVLLLEEDRAAVVAARGEEPLEALRRRRGDGRTLLVLRFPRP